MVEILAFIEKNITTFIIASLAMHFLLMILVVVQYGMINSLKDKYRRLMRGTDGKNIESLILEHMDRVEAVHQEIADVNRNVEILENRMSFAIQRIGILRYNAFDDMGSDLSYSIALLDENNNGVILTGIYGRTETVSYAKPVKGGTSSYSLSIEELQALDRAKKNTLDAVEIKATRSNKEIV